MVRSLSVACALLLAGSALAQSPRAADAPVQLATSSLGARLLSPSEGLTPSAVSTPAGSGWSVPGLIPHFGVAFATAFATIPAGQYLASLFGSLSNNLIAAAIPALLIMGFLAPALTTLAAWAFGNQNYLSSADKPYRFLVPWLINTGIHIASLVIAGFAGVTVGVPSTVFALALIEGSVMAGASVGSMKLLRNAPPDTVAARQGRELNTLRSFAPGVTDTLLVPLARTEF